MLLTLRMSSKHLQANDPEPRTEPQNLNLNIENPHQSPEALRGSKPCEEP